MLALSPPSRFPAPLVFPPTHFSTNSFSHSFSPICMIKRMAERCQHVDLNNDAICDCPHFVPKVNLTAAEVNICDGCLHTVAWHQIPSENPISCTTTSSEPFTTSTSAGSTSTASLVDEILASFTSQASSVSGAKKARTRGKKRASEAEACQEAVSGLKRSTVQDTSLVSPSMVHHIKNINY